MRRGASPKKAAYFDMFFSGGSLSIGNLPAKVTDPNWLEMLETNTRNSSRFRKVLLVLSDSFSHVFSRCPVKYVRRSRKVRRGLVALSRNNRDHMEGQR